MTPYTYSQINPWTLRQRIRSFPYNRHQFAFEFMKMRNVKRRVHLNSKQKLKQIVIFTAVCFRSLLLIYFVCHSHITGWNILKSKVIAAEFLHEANENMRESMSTNTLAHQVTSNCAIYQHCVNNDKFHIQFPCINEHELLMLGVSCFDLMRMLLFHAIYLNYVCK